MVPVFNTARLIPGLMKSIATQVATFDEGSYGPLRVLMIDNCSADGTVGAIHSAASEHGLSHLVDVIENPSNLGLARSLNTGLAAIDTDFVLTCHADCRFLTPDYVTQAVRLLSDDNSLAAVTGVPVLDDEATMIDRLYAASNLMDLGAVDDPRLFDSGLVQEIGFAEGRCDAFRMDALRQAGFYDVRVRLAGEDQLMAARFVEAGYRVVQHRGLLYVLGLSPQQDSLMRTVAHQRRLGQPAAFILSHPGVSAGALGARAGKNRRSRSLLRAAQALNVLGLAWLASRLLPGRSRSLRYVVGPLLVIVAASSVRQAQMQTAPGVRLTARDRVMLLVMQPLWDGAWAEGFVEGAVQVAIARLRADTNGTRGDA